MTAASPRACIYLQRPGHMRIEYDKPSPIVIVATKGKIYYYDGKLDQVSWVDLDDTPAWFLLQKRTSARRRHHGAEACRRDPGVLNPHDLTETKRAARGRVTLVFNDHRCNCGNGPSSTRRTRPSP